MYKMALTRIVVFSSDFAGFSGGGGEDFGDFDSCFTGDFAYNAVFFTCNLYFLELSSNFQLSLLLSHRRRRPWAGLPCRKAVAPCAAGLWNWKWISLVSFCLSIYLPVCLNIYLNRFFLSIYLTPPAVRRWHYATDRIQRPWRRERPLPR